MPHNYQLPATNHQNMPHGGYGKSQQLQQNESKMMNPNQFISVPNPTVMPGYNAGYHPMHGYMQFPMHGQYPNSQSIPNQNVN